MQVSLKFAALLTVLTSWIGHSVTLMATYDGNHNQPMTGRFFTDRNDITKM